MNAQHFDVLIIGAGLSGIGTACQIAAEFPDKSIAVLERRERLGGTWDLFRYPGIRSDSDMFTFGYKFRPWHDAEGRSHDGAVDPPVHRRHRDGVRHRQEDPLRPQDRRRRLVEPTRPLDGHGPARGDRRDAHVHLPVPRQLHRLLQLRRGLPADFPGRRRVPGSACAPPALAEDLDHTGKKVVVIGSGATAVTLVPSMAGDAAHVTMLQRSPSYIFSVPAVDKISESWAGSSRTMGVQARAPTQHRASSAPSTWRAVAGPSRCAASCSRTCAARSARLRHEPLHAEVHAVGRAAVRGPRRRPVQGAGLRRGVDRHRPHRHLHREGHPAEVRPASSTRTSSSRRPACRSRCSAA